MQVKKVFVVAMIIALFSIGAYARVPANALGLRFTGGNIFGAEVNYQRASWALFGSDRFELGVGWGSGGWRGHYDGRGPDSDWTWHNIGAAAVTQWHWNISPTAARGGFNWYVGPGVSAGMTTFSAVSREPGNPAISRSPELYLGIGGQIGIEYDFNNLGAPLNLSIDTRPMIDLINLGGTSLNAILGGLTLGFRVTF